MQSTGTTTLYPLRAAAVAVKSTAPFATVPVTMTVFIPRASRTASRSVPWNLSTPECTTGSPAEGASSRRMSALAPFRVVL